jgi:hypothetical protein
LTTAYEALRAALADGYRQSWRLVLLNAALSALLLPLLVASLWVPLLLVPAVVAAGVLATALMHCTVSLAQTEELRLRFALDGLRLHWRRGVVLGTAAALVFVAGVQAMETYGGVLAAIVAYLLVVFAAYLLTLWPLAVADGAASLRAVLTAAAETLMRRPLHALALTLVLVVVNVAGAAAALMPLLTLTIAYSFLAAAHFALPSTHLREAAD